MLREDLNFQQTLQTSTMWMYAISKREMIYFGLDEYFFLFLWRLWKLNFFLQWIPSKTGDIYSAFP